MGILLGATIILILALAFSEVDRKFDELYSKYEQCLAVHIELQELLAQMQVRGSQGRSLYEPNKTEGE